MADRKETNRVPFTVKWLEKVPFPKKGRAHYYDANLKHLGLRVESPDRKIFFWFRKVNGEPTFKKIGTYPATPIATAHGQVNRFDAQLEQYAREKFTGENPFKKKKKEQGVRVPTFKEMMDAYCERHLRTEANNPAQAEAVTRWMIKKHCGDWFDTRVDAITLEDVLTVRNALGTKYHMANRVVERLRAIFNWAGAQRDGSVNFWKLENPTRSVTIYKKKDFEPPRKVFLKPEELLRFNEALKTETHADLRDFLTLALATGARRGNILAMEWAAVDLDLRTWHLAETKTDPYDVTLSPAALKVLERRRSEIPQSAKFVFPSYGATGHVVDLKKEWTKFRKRAAIAHIRVHDLRRTCGSYMSMAGISMKQIGAALGHSTQQATEIYSELAQEVVAEARAAGERKMVQMMKRAKKRTKRLVGPRRKLLKGASNANA
jgi:integrase